MRKLIAGVAIVVGTVGLSAGTADAWKDSSQSSCSSAGGGIGRAYVMGGSNANTYGAPNLVGCG